MSKDEWNPLRYCTKHRVVENLKIVSKFSSVVKIIKRFLHYLVIYQYASSFNYQNIRHGPIYIVLKTVSFEMFVGIADRYVFGRVNKMFDVKLNP